jgi:hypothetical protein
VRSTPAGGAAVRFHHEIEQLEEAGVLHPAPTPRHRLVGHHQVEGREHHDVLPHGAYPDVGPLVRPGGVLAVAGPVELLEAQGAGELLLEGIEEIPPRLADQGMVVELARGTRRDNGLEPSSNGLTDLAALPAPNHACDPVPRQHHVSSHTAPRSEATKHEP